MRTFCTLITITAFLTACGGTAGVSGTATTSATITRHVFLPPVTPTVTPSPTETLIPSPTSDNRIPPERWKEWPVLPVVRPEMKAIFQLGIALGNNPAAFSKIGDGEISTVWFLTQYDLAATNYHLGAYTDLQSVIIQFSGSFRRVGMAAGRGYNTGIILGPVLAGTLGCDPGESHIDCELRTFHPSFAFLSLGTNQVWQPEVFEPGMRQIIERLLKAGVVPILSTKADNLEGNYHINYIIAHLAFEYNLPLWNFWLVVQPLPEQGLQADREHLTYAYSDFSNPINFKYAWPWRNLTALQVLGTVYQAVTSQP